MNTAATIQTRKEIVAVLKDLNNKIEHLGKPNSPYADAQLTIFLSLRNYYLGTLVAMNHDPAVTNMAA